MSPASLFINNVVGGRRAIKNEPFLRSDVVNMRQDWQHALVKLRISRRSLATCIMKSFILPVFYINRQFNGTCSWSNFDYSRYANDIVGSASSGVRKNRLEVNLCPRWTYCRRHILNTAKILLVLSQITRSVSFCFSRFLVHLFVFSIYYRWTPDTRDDTEVKWKRENDDWKALYTNILHDMRKTKMRTIITRWNQRGEN